ncbi:unnamed protein product [Brassicogethes aeneus]|uniref:BEN domain-containing protein n=1 Tax=Brassicogethes aeneus TaxID=1431903 RepID=A0A9P0FD74_BRAAE|nr:unnamed protein product [Brassicogethes aeneus]
MESNIKKEIGDVDNELPPLNQWMIVYFPGSEPGFEYEVVNQKDVVTDFLETIDSLQKGSSVQINCGGKARVSAIVIAISDDQCYLEANMQKIVDEHSKDAIKNIIGLEQKKSKKRKLNRNSSGSTKSETSSDVSCASASGKDVNDESSIILVYEDASMVGTEVSMSTLNRSRTIILRDQETQTEDRAAEMNRDYLTIKKKYEDMKAEYQKFCNLFREVRTNMNDSLAVFENFDGNGKKPIKPKFCPPDENDVVDKENNKKMVTIGSNGTKVENKIYEAIKWGNHSAATKTLLKTCFTREVLATHSLTGKPSPAFINSNKKTKKRLNPLIVNDIIECIVKKCNVPEPMVRQAITSKCADENKLLRRRESNV